MQVSGILFVGWSFASHKATDFFREGYTGDVDPVTGFALVASLTTCFVWKYSQVRTVSGYVIAINSRWFVGFDRYSDVLHLQLPY